MNRSLSVPLLTIAMPTYNRAGVLSIGLKGLRNVAEPFGNQVEVVVSNNHSTDKTQQVLDANSEWSQLRVVRPPKHLTGTQHILWVGQNAGLAEFCWLMGDDDLVLPGGIAAVLEALARFPKVDYVLANYACAPMAIRDALATSKRTAYVPSDQSLASGEGQTGTFPNLAALVENSGWTIESYTAIVGHVFRCKVWHDARIEAVVERAKSHFDTIENTFPHLMMLISVAGEKPVGFIREPCMLLGQGLQTPRSWPFIVAFRLRELIDCYANLGVGRVQLSAFETAWLKRVGEILLHEPKWFFKLRPIRDRRGLLSSMLVALGTRNYSTTQWFAVGFRRLRTVVTRPPL
jgi:hypothetical protein